MVARSRMQYYKQTIGYSTSLPPFINSGYCAGPHRSSEHRCNVVGCASKQGAVCTHTQEKCPNCKGNHIAFSGKCAKKIEAITMARQSRKVQPNGRETREVPGANRVALGTRQARDTRKNEGEGEPTADEEQGDTGEMEGAEMEKAVTMSETTTEIEMGAAASND
jgi:hypothetical protein